MTDDVRQQLADAVCRMPVVWTGILLTPTTIADALLPVVERIARQRAAHELRKAADDWELRGLTLTANELRTRADQLENNDT